MSRNVSHVTRKRSPPKVQPQPHDRTTTSSSRLPLKNGKTRNASSLFFLLLLLLLLPRAMASTAPPPQASFSLFAGRRRSTAGTRIARDARVPGRRRLRVFAAQGPRERQQPPPGVDTRIHWENEDEGWIGGDSSGSKEGEKQLGAEAEEEQRNLLGEKFADLLNESSDSHYQ